MHYNFLRFDRLTALHIIQDHFQSRCLEQVQRAEKKNPLAEMALVVELYTQFCRARTVHAMRLTVCRSVVYVYTQTGTCCASQCVQFCSLHLDPYMLCALMCVQFCSLHLNWYMQRILVCVVLQFTSKLVHTTNLSVCTSVVYTQTGTYNEPQCVQFCSLHLDLTLTLTNMLRILVRVVYTKTGTCDEPQCVQFCSLHQDWYMLRVLVRVVLQFTPRLVHATSLSACSFVVYTKTGTCYESQ